MTPASSAPSGDSVTQAWGLAGQKGITVIVYGTALVLLLVAFGYMLGRRPLSD